jgi:hypothetical protein
MVSSGAIGLIEGLAGARSRPASGARDRSGADAVGRKGTAITMVRAALTHIRMGEIDRTAPR